MSIELENIEWIELAPYLAKAPRINPFDTPVDYFTNLEPQIKNTVFLAQIAGDEENHGLTVPQDYFISLAANIKTTVNLSKETKSKSSFEVPVNYFAQLQNSLAAKTIHSELATKPRIIKLWHKDLLKYASAACLIFVSFFGGYYYSQHSDSTPDTPVQTEVAKDGAQNKVVESTTGSLQNSENISKPENPTSTDTEMENYLLNHYTANELAQDL